MHKMLQTTQKDKITKQERLVYSSLHSMAIAQVLINLLRKPPTARSPP